MAVGLQGQGIRVNRLPTFEAMDPRLFVKQPMDWGGIIDRGVGGYMQGQQIARQSEQDELDKELAKAEEERRKAAAEQQERLRELQIERLKDEQLFGTEGFGLKPVDGGGQMLFDNATGKFTGKYFEPKEAAPSMDDYEPFRVGDTVVPDTFYNPNAEQGYNMMRVVRDENGNPAGMEFVGRTSTQRIESNTTKNTNVTGMPGSRLELDEPVLPDSQMQEEYDFDISNVPAESIRSVQQLIEVAENSDDEALRQRAISVLRDMGVAKPKYGNRATDSSRTPAPVEPRKIIKF